MKSRPVFGILLVLVAFYAIYLYDTGRWMLIRAAITGAPGTPIPPVANQAGGGTVLPPGNHPSIGPSAAGSGAHPPALPSSGTPGIVPGMTGKASWLSAGQALIQSIWPPASLPGAPVMNAGGNPGYTPGIIGEPAGGMSGVWA